MPDEVQIIMPGQVPAACSSATRPACIECGCLGFRVYRVQGLGFRAVSSGLCSGCKFDFDTGASSWVDFEE